MSDNNPYGPPPIASIGQAAAAEGSSGVAMDPNGSVIQNPLMPATPTIDSTAPQEPDGRVPAFSGEGRR